MSKGSSTTRTGSSATTRAMQTNGGGKRLDIDSVIANANKQVDWWRSKPSEYNITDIKEESDRVVVKVNSRIMSGAIVYTPEGSHSADVDDSELYWRAPKNTDYYAYKEHINNLTGHTYDAMRKYFPGKQVHIKID